MKQPGTTSPAPGGDVDLRAPGRRWRRASGRWLWLPFFILLVALCLAQGAPLRSLAWMALSIPAMFFVLFAVWIGWVLIVRRGALTWMRLARAPARALAGGNSALAERALARALARADRFRPQDRRRGVMFVELAGFLKAQGRYHEAKALFEDSVAILARRWRSNPMDYFVALNNCAACAIDLRDHAAAQRVLEQILDLTLVWKQWRQSGPSSRNYQAQSLALVLHYNLAFLFIQVGELAEAADHVHEMEAILPRLSRRQRAQLGDHYVGIHACLMYARGQFADAAREIERARDPNHLVCLHVSAQLALVRLAHAEAERLLRQCFSLIRKKGSLHRPDLRDHALELAESLFGQGKHDEALAALQEARAITADFALPPGKAWRRALGNWLQRAQQLHQPDLAASLEADLHRAGAAEQALTISPRLRVRPPLP
jgi:tetratricopeptide (TPR) repeat protein